jgi:hypothetical protein
MSDYSFPNYFLTTKGAKIMSDLNKYAKNNELVNFLSDVIAEAKQVEETAKKEPDELKDHLLQCKNTYRNLVFIVLENFNFSTIEILKIGQIEYEKKITVAKNKEDKGRTYYLYAFFTIPDAEIYIDQLATNKTPFKVIQIELHRNICSCEQTILINEFKQVIPNALAVSDVASSSLAYYVYSIIERRAYKTLAHLGANAEMLFTTDQASSLIPGKLAVEYLQQLRTLYTQYSKLEDETDPDQNSKT